MSGAATVLLVEDDTSARAIAVRALKGQGFVVLEADPTRINPSRIKDVKVLMTIKEGQVIYDRGRTKNVRAPFLGGDNQP